ncbi:porphobilinogen synthase [Hasllibacter halocynthiae]|uniref:Delta-aminolevulinic acid dehydratase n=1 Tax=Hasllibacter halocynthiae TaxID=595589 RepID=A0A2T0X884_9RHOB|nr:porphobilinogen synthase [Hasllibacter halocynthiae]PRY95158.1 porphobilinogen synthase [Hasllibacter halocynthiae]
MRPTIAPFPLARPRRRRRTPALRAMVREHALTPSDLIWPIFVTEGEDREDEVASMPGVTRRTVDRAVAAAQEARDLGIPCLCVFPHVDPSLKSAACEEAWSPDSLSNRAFRAIKAAVPEVALMSDVALDPYNVAGHDGLVRDGRVLNDESVEALVRMAVSQAEAGADILGPSDMMDGRVGAIRAALEEGGHSDTAILAYSAKYASAFYGPFRDAVGASGALAGSTAGEGKQTYQMDPANTEEALRMIERDLSEGADMVMVKPGMPYLDIVRRVHEAFAVPTFAYQVSGEYAMIAAAAANGWLDRDEAVLESLIAFKRAGCDGVLSYFAPEAARALSR